MAVISYIITSPVEKTRAHTHTHTHKGIVTVRHILQENHYGRNKWLRHKFYKKPQEVTATQMENITRTTGPQSHIWTKRLDKS
jgi:hypothetical protein